MKTWSGVRTPLPKPSTGLTHNCAICNQRHVPTHLCVAWRLTEAGWQLDVCLPSVQAEEQG